MKTYSAKIRAKPGTTSQIRALVIKICAIPWTGRSKTLENVPKRLKFVSRIMATAIQKSNSRKRIILRKK